MADTLRWRALEEQLLVLAAAGQRRLARVRAGRGWQSRQRFLFAFAGLIFLAGLAWSFGQLDVSFRQLRAAPLLILLLLLAPLSLVYGALGLVMLARVARVPMSFGRAFRVGTFAQLAEMLPLPGGAIVRTGALVEAGHRPIHSALLVTATAMLWVLLAATGAGIVLLGTSPTLGSLLLATGAIGTAAILGWIWRQAGPWLTMLTLAHRTIGLGLTATRLVAAFAVLNQDVSLASTLPFALAAIAGSAASIAPGGLGISEVLAALMATAVAASAAAAFVAVSLNRIVGLASTGLIAALLTMTSRKSGPKLLIEGAP